MLASVKFRGEEIDVEFERLIEDPEVNFYGVDWDFIEVTVPEATNDEIAEIEKQLWKFGYDRQQKAYEDSL